MANFGGHAIPGGFFLLYGLWLAVKHTMQYSWGRSKSRRNESPSCFKRMEFFEGGFAIFAAFVGIMVEQFVVDGPHVHLYDRGTQSWVKLMNWQHSTMYLFFGFAGAAILLCAWSRTVLAGLDRLGLSIALFVEGFLFYYHLHNRPPLDAHVHSLLLVAVFAAAASTLLEVFMRNHMILELLRATLLILQGSWFFQIGFVLYPLSGPQWDLDMHDNIMFVTMCFCWHLAAALLTVSLISSLVWFVVRQRSGRDRDAEFGMRKTSSASPSEKALLEESEEE